MGKCPSPPLLLSNVLRLSFCRGISGNVGALVVERGHWGIVGASAAARWRGFSCWGGGVACWQSDSNVRALMLAHCCWRRGDNATINIRWEVGWGHVTKGGAGQVSGVHSKCKDGTFAAHHHHCHWQCSQVVMLLGHQQQCWGVGCRASAERRHWGIFEASAAACWCGFTIAAGVGGWCVGGVMTMSGRWCWRTAVGGGGRTQQSTLDGRWDGGT